MFEAAEKQHVRRCVITGQRFQCRVAFLVFIHELDEQEQAQQNHVVVCLICVINHEQSQCDFECVLLFVFVLVLLCDFCV